MQKINIINGRFERLLDDIICPICDKKFHPKLRITKYCSKNCADKSNIGKKQSKETIRKRFIWNKEYKHSDLTKEKIRTSALGNNGGRGNSGKIKIKMRGENHWNWKGGVGRHKRNYASKQVEYKNWRKDVFRKDNWTCVNCGNKKDIVAHHIKSWFKFPELRYVVDNGLTVCKSCHSGIHYFFGKYT